MALKISGASIGNITGGPVSIALADLSDVLIALPSDGQYLRYNGTTSEWNNFTIDSDIFNYLDGNIIGNNGITVTPLAGPNTITFGLGNITPTSINTGTITATTINATTINATIAGNADTATKLQTARSISATGDAAWTVSFDGSVNVTAPITLATVNAAPQTNTFRKITVNGKGLVTATSAVAGSDITTALGYTPVNRAGDTMTGALVLSADPTAALGAATKQYVDNVASGLSAHAAVVTSTTATLATSSAGTVTYNNGTAGVGATLTTTGSFATIGAFSTTNGDRILVKDEATQAHNGVYVRTSATVLTRASDFDDSPDNEVAAGDFVYVQQGTLGGTQWVVTTTGNITIGTTGIVFSQLSGAGTITGGTGITVTGNSVALATGNTLSLFNLATNGLVARTAAGTVTARSIAVSGTGLSVSNADGVAGNPTVTSNATNLNTASTIVARDASGNFTAGTITAALSGNATTATTATNANNVAIVNDIATATSVYPVWSNGTSGNQTLEVSNTKLSFVPSTGILTATGFSGSGANLTSIPNAALVNSTTTIGTTAIALGASSTTLAGLTSVTSTSFVGALTGNSSTATTLQTARTLTIGATGKTFNGGADVAWSLSEIGATTVGSNLFGLANPSAVTFLRVNADNTVSTLDAAAFRTAIGAGTSSTVGTVTSVSGTGTVSGITLTGTVTASGNLTLGGTLAVTPSNFASQTANTFLAAPNGAAGTPTFRTIVAADIPTLNQNTTGTATNATNVGIVDDVATAVSVYPTWSNGTSGNQALEVSSTKLSFVPSTGILTATGFSGSGANLTGIPNAALVNSTTTIGTTAIALGASSTTLAGLTSVTSTSFVGALTGNASTATTSTNANNVAIVDDVATATTVYPTWSNGTSGNQALEVSSTKLSFVPSTGILTATGFSGSGASLTSLTAGNLTGTIPSAVLGSSTFYVGTTAVTLNRASANQALTGISSITLPGATSGTIQLLPTAVAGTTVLTLPATSGTVALTSQLPTVNNGTLTLNVSGTGLSGSASFTANQAGASTFTVTSNATDLNTASTIVARDASGNFTAGTITATLSGNATSATNATNVGIVDDVATAVSVYPTWSNGTSGNQALEVSSTKLSFVPSTGILTATGFSGSGAALTNIPNAALTNSSVTIGTTAIALGASSTTLTGLTSVTSTSFTGALTGNASTATALATGRTIGMTGDVTWTSASFTGAGNVTGTSTLATVNAAPQTDTFRKITVNGKGLVTATSAVAAVDITTALGYTPVNKAGDTMTGALVLSADPTAALGAATKQYVDNVASGLSAHAAVVTATTATLATSSAGTITYNNGTAGVGATLTTTGSFATIGGVATADGDRILVKDEATQANNGVYVRTSATVLTRASDFDDSPDNEVAAGDFVYVQEGTLGGTQWVLTTTGNVVLGTTALVFSQLSGAGVVTGGTGITVTGNSVALATGNTLSLFNLATNGLVARTAAGTVTARNLAVSGTGLSVSNQDGVAGNPTITSNATNLNTASTIVARDGSGNFTAGTITAALSGNATTATTATNANNVAIVNDIATATTVYPVWSNGTSGNQALEVSNTKLSFVPSTGILTATGFAGSGAALTSIPNSALVNSSTTIGTTAIALGASSTTLAGLTSVTSTSFVGALTGNASTATTLQTARTLTIGATGKTFNGSADVAWSLSEIGATTVGSNLFGLTNPSAVTFLRVNADNTVSALDAAAFRTAIGAGTSSTVGTVTSVGGTGTVSGITLTGTVTSSGNLTLGGTLAVTPSDFSSQTANTFLAAPNGAAGVPTFRAIVAADIPTLNQNTTGTATNASNVAIVNDVATATAVYPVWSNGTSGNQALEVSNTKLSFVPSTGILTATGFSGSGASLTSIPNAALVNSSVTIGTTAIALGASSTTLAGLTSVTSTSFVGALTGNASTATTATNANNVAIVNDVATATTVYPTWSNGTSGNQALEVSSTKLSFVPSTGILTATGFSSSSITYGTNGETTSASLTTSTTTANQVVATLSATAFRSAKYLIQVTSGTNYHVTEITVIHNGTTAFMTEYGTVLTNSSLATFDTDISGGNVRLLVTPVNAVTTIKTLITSITA